MEKLFLLLLGLTAEDVDKSLITYYIEKSKSSICNYVFKTGLTVDDVESQYESQVVELAVYYYSNRNDVGIKSKSQGSRSTTYEDSDSNGIPKSIRDSLPKYVRIM